MRWLAIIMAGAAAALAVPAAAQDIAPASETAAYIFTTMLALLGAAALPLGAAGFGMFESGLSRARNAASAALKMTLICAIAAIAAWVSGASLADSVERGGLLGVFGVWAPQDADLEAGRAAPFAHFLFLAAQAGLCAAIVSGAIAERVRVLPFAVFVALMCALIQPIVQSWTGVGYLADKWGFVDAGGGATLHVVGGAAAFAGVIVAGPRRGRYAATRAHAARASNAPLALIGGFALAGAMTLVATARYGALASAADIIAISSITGRMSLAAAGAVLAATLLNAIVYKKVDPTIIANAGVGGLAALAADPLSGAIWQALLIGGFAGVIVAVAIPFFDRMKIDDVTGAAPTHFLCGAWGVFVVAWTRPEATFLAQTLGVFMIAAFAFAMSLLVFVALRFSIGLRPTAEGEQQGLDRIDCGVDAYPEFRRG
jgi:Amt family ammonium transporter